MNVSEEIDALRSMGFDPLRRVSRATMSRTRRCGADLDLGG